MLASVSLPKLQSNQAVQVDRPQSEWPEREGVVMLVACYNCKRVATVRLRRLQRNMNNCIKFCANDSILTVNCSVFTVSPSFTRGLPAAPHLLPAQVSFVPMPRERDCNRRRLYNNLINKLNHDFLLPRCGAVCVSAGLSEEGLFILLPRTARSNQKGTICRLVMMYACGGCIFFSRTASR